MRCWNRRLSDGWMPVTDVRILDLHLLPFLLKMTPTVGNQILYLDLYRSNETLLVVSSSQSLCVIISSFYWLILHWFIYNKFAHYFWTKVGLTASIKLVGIRVQSTCLPTQGLVALINEAQRFIWVSNAISVTAIVIVLATISVLGAFWRPWRPMSNENPFSTVTVNKMVSNNNRKYLEHKCKASMLSRGSLTTKNKPFSLFENIDIQRNIYFCN